MGGKIIFICFAFPQNTFRSLAKPVEFGQTLLFALKFAVVMFTLERFIVHRAEFCFALGLNKVVVQSVLS